MVTGEVAPRSYEISTPEGTICRNRRDLIPIPESSGDGAQTEGSTVVNSSTQEDNGNRDRLVLRRSCRTQCPPDRYNPSWT